MRIGIYGGSFDPPHRGHRIAAEKAKDALGLDRLLVVPANQPPHKQLTAGSPSPEERLEMTRLAFRDLPGTEVSDIELSRGGRSYTVETLERLHAMYPEDELVLLMGTDMFLCLEKWFRFGDILRLAVIGAFSRNPGEDADLAKMERHLAETCGARVERIETDPFPVSSTQVRALLTRRMGRELLDPAVYETVISRRYYGAKPSLSWLRSVTEPLQDPARIPHVRGCEEEAARLAERWGVSAEDAREAAILHDLTKKYDLAEQLKLCREYGMITDTLESCSSMLLHSKTSAAEAEKRFGCPAEIVSAIRFHTTGRAGMTTLEKVVCLADAIEPTRTYADLTEIRKLAYTDLDAALRMSFEGTLQSLARRGLDVHPATLQALEDLKK